MNQRATSPLQEKIIRMIETGGPISLADYMHLCLADPEHGYYRQREAIGGSSSKGDFITAPEISQMFGELIGIWCVSVWQALYRPARFTLAELGPGNGTLMRDALRAASQLPGFCDAADLRLMESSQRLRERQLTVLEGQIPSLNSFAHIAEISELPDQPTIVIANEFLDAIPFRQYVKTGGSWNEVGVSVSTESMLERGATAATLEPTYLPQGAEEEAEGALFEHSPAREAVVEGIATHIVGTGGAALFIDYGHLKSGFGDTFQAIRDHAYTDPMEMPGEADLTSHVDFERAQLTARSVEGIETALTTQGEFLLSLGLLERAGALGSGKSPEIQDNIRTQVERLAAPEQMGDLFKVMSIFTETLKLPGFDR